MRFRNLRRLSVRWGLLRDEELQGLSLLQVISLLAGWGFQPLARIYIGQDGITSNRRPKLLVLHFCCQLVSLFIPSCVNTEGRRLWQRIFGDLILLLLLQNWYMKVVWFITTLEPLDEVCTFLFAEIQSGGQLWAHFMH